MAPVRLSDAYVHDVYGSYQSLNNPEQSRFVQSGVITNSELLNAIAKGGGKLSTVPFWNDIDPTIEPNYSNDDPADLAVPNKIGSGSMTARKAWLNQAFADMDLVQELAGSSPMQHIRNRFGTYWLRQQNRRLIAMVKGVMASNVANNGGDMVTNISAEAGDAARFNSDSFVDATYQMGEYTQNLAAIAVHSQVKARMVKNDDIVTIQDSNLGINVETYRGAEVIVDNTLGFTGTGLDRVYLSVVFGRGSFGWGTEDGSAFAVGEGIPRVPFEIDRVPASGNGGGQEQIWERKTWLMHPYGTTWIEDPTGTGNDLVEFSPTLADLANAAHWSRIVAREQIPMSFIVSKA